MIEKRLPELIELCRRHAVMRLEIFGCATTADFDPSRSALELVVELSPEADAPWLADYVDFKNDLEALFQRDVELYMAGAIRESRNPYLQESFAETRTVVYAA